MTDENFNIKFLIYRKTAVQEQRIKEMEMQIKKLQDENSILRKEEQKFPLSNAINLFDFSCRSGGSRPFDILPINR